MKHIVKSIFLSLFLSTFVVVGVYAWDIDYGDAVGYGEASNDKGIWQRLGEVNGIDDAVTWSVNGLDFDTTADLIIGEEVTFRFNYWQGNNGDHTYDQLYAVVDWNQDFFWDDSEVIIYEKIDTLAQDGWERAEWNDYSLARYITYEASFLVPDTMNVGSTWLRARAHCNHTPYPDITPYGHLWNQGETEDYQLSIKAAVPEPSTIVLLSFGLLGLVCINRKKLLMKL